jgi:chromosome segregation ATPase
VIGELRSALEDREQCVKDLHCQLEQEAEEARHVRVALEARIGELERASDGLQRLLDEERARFERFLGELTGGIGQRGTELDALDRELTALVGG